MKLRLDGQNRSRTAEEYSGPLYLDLDEESRAQSRILVVGSGLMGRDIALRLPGSQIVCVDLTGDSALFGLNPGNFKELAADFTLADVVPDSFDRVWVLYSLPSYAQNDAAIKLFFLNAAIACRPAGQIRVAPITADVHVVQKYMTGNRVRDRIGSVEWSIKILQQSGFQVEYIKAQDKLRV